MDKIPSEVIWTLLAIFGGVARYFDIYLKDSPNFMWTRFMASIVVSAFSGFMTAHILLLISPAWVFVGAGIGGYASTKFLDIFVNMLHKKLGVNDDKPKEPKQKPKS